MPERPSAGAKIAISEVWFRFRSWGPRGVSFATSRQPGPPLWDGLQGGIKFRLKRAGLGAQDTTLLLDCRSSAARGPCGPRGGGPPRGDHTRTPSAQEKLSGLPCGNPFTGSTSGKPASLRFIVAIRGRAGRATPSVRIERPNRPLQWSSPHTKWWCWLPPDLSGMPRGPSGRCCPASVGIRQLFASRMTHRCA